MDKVSAIFLWGVLMHLIWSTCSIILSINAISLKTYIHCTTNLYIWMQFVLLIIGISNTVLFLSAVYYVGRHINQCPQNPKNWPIGVPRSPITVTGMTLPPHIEARYNIKRRANVNSQPTTSFPPTTRVQAPPTP